MGNTLALTLIRHGLTTYNEEKRYIGVTDLPLTKRGKEQINAINVDKNNSHNRLLISSDLLRCKETTELLYPESPYITLSTLREMNFGEWEGKTYEQLKDRKEYRDWLDDPLSVTPPQGESYQHFQQRTKLAMGQVIDLVMEKEVSQATLITHGGVIRQWLTLYSPEKRTFFEWNVSIGSAFTLTGDVADVRRGLRFTSLLEEPITVKTNGH